MSISKNKNYLSEYRALDPPARKRVLRTLKHWGGWTKTSVYRKLACPNLSPIERVLIEGVLRHETDEGKNKQLEIAFKWESGRGKGLFCTR